MEKVGSEDDDGKCNAFVSAQGEVMQVLIVRTDVAPSNAAR
jgi:hypothetical protein